MLKITELKCEYRVNPIGIESRHPRLFWKAKGNSERQLAYRVIVGSSEQAVSDGTGDLFDTGRVVGSDFYAEYGGKALPSRCLCWWKVFLWSEQGMAESEVAFFETGLDASDWKGTWMSMPANYQGGTTLYRKIIELLAKPILRARAYVCGLGYCEAFVNGQKLGTAVLNPAVTDYSRSVLYSTYDILPLLKTGDNVFGAEIGHGWLGAKKVLVQIYIDYADGEIGEFHSSVNGGWWVGGSPTVDNSIYGGEVYDARLEDPSNWATVDYEPTWDKGWMFTIYSAPPEGTLEAQEIDPIEIVDTYSPVSITEKAKGVFVVDVGRNIAGWARIRVRGERGSRITLKFGERLTDDGFVNRLNLRSARASDTYILKGEGEETYAPRFTYHGFQYIQVEIKGDCTLLSIVGEHVHTNVRIAGQFECSDDELNRLHANAVVTELNNEHGILTDCPQRDERFGWLNDLGSRLFQTVYNCGMERFFPKFTRDITHTQTADGAIGDTVPYYTGGRPADPVCCAYLLIPVMSYVYYGDRRCAEREYENCKRWVNYLLSRSNGYIMDYSYYADWVAPDCFPIKTDRIYVSTVYLYWHLKLMGKLAEITKNEADRAAYALMAEESAHAINEKYFDRATGHYAEGTQAADSMALTLGIVPKEDRERVAKQVFESVKEVGYHSTCGNVGYRHLFYVLGDYGYAEAALKILKNPEYPGWGFMLANGATSVWERWEEKMSDVMDSFDHPMFGSYDAFFYHYLGGIRINDDAFGCDRVTIAPVVPQDLSFVNTSFDTVRGKIVSNWKKTADGVLYHVEIPWSVEAEIKIGGRTERVCNGIYEFTDREKSV